MPMPAMRAACLVLTALVPLALGAAASATAQPQPQRPIAADPGSSSFITPFPDNDTYRIQLFGESLAEGLLGGLIETFAKEPKLQFGRKHRTLSSLIKGDISEEAKGIEGELDREAPHIAIIMPNMTQRFPWRENFERRFPPGSEARKEEVDRRRVAWKGEYGQRIDRLMRAFKRKNIAVYWVGLPIMRNNFTSEDAQVVNEMIRERALVNGGKFIDIYAGFADEDGTYTSSGPDLDGKTRQMRDQDGIHFTSAGYRKLAHFLERDLKRDLAQARTERTVSLAGNEEEQKKVRPPSTVPVSALARPGNAPGATTKDRQAAADRGGAPRASSAVPDSNSGDVRADSSRITLRTVNLQGREDNITIEILRPSIPAPVLAAVTRRESADKASQVGDPIMTEIAGGQTMISSVTPFAESSSDRRRTAAGNAPYQLVLEKGERLPSKPGRSDDLPWPRVEAPPPVTKVEREPQRAIPNSKQQQQPSAPKSSTPRG